MTTPDEPTVAPEDVLPCGVGVEELLTQVAEGQPPRDPAHQAACPHCRAMLVELAELWAPVEAWGRQQPEVPDSLAASVMQRVVALSTHGWHSRVDTELGVNRVAAWVVAVVAHRAAAGVSGVATVRSQILPAGDVGPLEALLDGRLTRRQQALASGVGVAGRNVVVRISLTVTVDTPPLPWVVARVREEITVHVAELTGLDAREIDVLVEAMEDPPADA